MAASARCRQAAAKSARSEGAAQAPAAKGSASQGGCAGEKGRAVPAKAVAKAPAKHAAKKAVAKKAATQEGGAKKAAKPAKKAGASKAQERQEPARRPRRRRAAARRSAAKHGDHFLTTAAERRHARFAAVVFSGFPARRWRIISTMTAAEPDLGTPATTPARTSPRERVKASQDMAAALAHELRGPVFGITSAAQLLRYRITDDPVVEKNIGRIMREAERLNSLVATLLEYGRPEPVQLAPANPDDIWDRVLDAITAARSRQRRFSPSTRPPSLRRSATSIADQLGHAFSNALANAIDAAPEGTDLAILSSVGADGTWESSPPQRRIARRARDACARLRAAREHESRVIPESASPSRTASSASTAARFRSTSAHGIGTTLTFKTSRQSWLNHLSLSSARTRVTLPGTPADSPPTSPRSSTPPASAPRTRRRAPRRARVRFASTSRTDCSARPEGTGTAATYNYRHFLQLLAIKIRQREGVTLDIIKKEMTELTGDALERRVASSLAAALGATVETRRQATDDEPRRAGGAFPSPTASSCTCATTPRRRATKRSSPCARPFAPRSGREDIR